jgi:hypothetical protein
MSGRRGKSFFFAGFRELTDTILGRRICGCWLANAVKISFPLVEDSAAADHTLRRMR